MSRSQCLRVALAVAVLLAAPLSAQDVTAELKGGTLVVTGQAGPEDITLANFTLDDAGGQSIQVSHRVGTTINGSTLDIGFEHVKAIKLDMGAGDDHVALQDITLDGHVTLRGGGGSDSFELQNAILGPTKISQGEGRLILTLGGASFAKDLVVVGGTGDDDVHLLLVSVARNLVFHLGGGNDSLVLDDTDVGGNALLDLSIDDNQLSSNSCDFAKGVSVKGGPGTETVSITDADIARTLKFSLDTGPNHVTLGTLVDNFVAHKDIVLKAGDQDDQVSFTLPTGSCTIEGKVKLSLGPGDNSVGVSGAVQFSGLRIAAGAGADLVTTDGAQIQSDVQLLLGGGDNGASFEDTAMQGDLLVTGGTGDDAVGFLGTTTVAGKQTYKLGGGNNSHP